MWLRLSLKCVNHSREVCVRGQTVDMHLCLRVTQVQVEVLAFQVWMDAMEAKEREEILDFLENRD